MSKEHEVQTPTGGDEFSDEFAKKKRNIPNKEDTGSAIPEPTKGGDGGPNLDC